MRKFQKEVKLKAKHILFDVDKVIIGKYKTQKNTAKSHFTNYHFPDIINALTSHLIIFILSNAAANAGSQGWSTFTIYKSFLLNKFQRIELGCKER